MEIINQLKNNFFYAIEQGSLGFSLIEICLIILSFILALLLRSLFAKFIISKIKKIVQKTNNTIDNKIFDTLAAPLRTLPIIFVFIFVRFLIDNDNHLSPYLEKINQTLVTIFLFWIIHQSLTPLSQTLYKLEELFSKALILWLIRSLKYLIIFLGVVAVLETWGIKIGPVIAGLGLFGVAVALGAQDLFKNLISGIMIILEKRFELNDVIEVPGYAKGTVEHIGFRSTLIRQFDSTPISIPNYIFSDTSIINFSDRKYRRINWIIGLTYNTSTDQLKSICLDIDKYIRNSNNFIINNSFQLFVRVEQFNDSSIDILVSAFTNTNDWNDFLKIKEDLVFQIKNIVELNNSSFAFPSKSIYIEKNL